MPFNTMKRVPMILTNLLADSLFSQILAIFESSNKINSCNYQEILLSYNLLLNNSTDTLQSGFDIADDKIFRYYRHDIVICEASITFCWDIRKLKKVISSKHLLPERLEVSKAYSVVDKSNIQAYKLKQVNSDPIIVGIVPFSHPSYLILDGNHRTAAYYLKKKNTIKAFILKPDVHIHAMPLYFQRCFKIFSNIQHMLRYVQGLIPLSEFEDSFFDIENVSPAPPPEPQR